MADCKIQVFAYIFSKRLFAGLLTQKRAVIYRFHPLKVIKLST